MNSENTESDKKQSLINITYDVSDPEHPEAIKIQNRTRTKNADRQARYRQKLENEGKTKAQIYIPEDRKSELEQIAKKLTAGEDVTRAKELESLNKTMSDLSEQIKGLSVQLQKSQQELEKSQVELKASQEEAKASNKKIEKVPKLVKWFFKI